MELAQIARGYKLPISKRPTLRHNALSIIIVSIAFLGAAHILIRTSLYGIKISTDSRAYMGFAEAIVHGGIHGERLVWYPPFLSMLLAFFRLLNVNLVETARFINIIAFGLIILLVGHYLSRHIRSHFFVVGATFTIMLSFPIISVSSYALTETLFILLMLLALVQMESFWSGRTAKSGLVFSAVFSALAPLTRWIGITVIATGIILILTSPAFPASRRYKYAAFYATWSSLPLALWLGRNWMINESLIGRRTDFASGQSLADSLSQLGDTLHLWTFLHQEHGWTEYMLWAAAVLAILETVRFLIAHQKRQQLHTFNIHLKETKLDQYKGWRTAIPFATFTSVYLATLLIAVPITVGQPISSRYLAPVWGPAIIVAVILLETFWLNTYQRSGISARKSPDGWSVHHNKSSGPIALTGWLLIFLIFAIVLDHYMRTISIYLDAITYYNPHLYTSTTTL